MTSIDKSDVDISKLFTWGKKFEITSNTGKIDVYIRLIGDEDLNKARVYALRKSSELRKKLKEKDSDERLAYIPDIEYYDKDLLVEQLVLFRVKELATEAVSELQFNIPKEPDSRAGLEEQEKYQELIDKFPEEREVQIRKHIEQRVDKERELYKSKSLEELYRELERSLINQACESEMVIRFREMCTYFGTYSDEKFKKRFFSNLEQFSNLPSQIKNELMDSYLTLEISGEELKK